MRLTKFLTWCLAILLSAGIASSCKSKNNDADIQASLAGKLPAGVSSSVMEGVVTLTGSCPDENCRTTAEASAKDVKGVKSVVNNISVSVVGNAPVEISDDQTLTSSVNSAISAYPSVQATVNNGVVTLTGTINRSDLTPLMQSVQALNPKSVENKLVVNN